jgi:hypothetical protein
MKYLRFCTSWINTKNLIRNFSLFCLLIFLLTNEAKSQTKTLVQVLDSIAINELNHHRDTVHIDLDKEYPIIIVDGYPISRLKLSRFKLNEITSITPVSDTTTSVMFDKGQYGIIILRTNLSKRQLKRKL